MDKDTMTVDVQNVNLVEDDVLERVGELDPATEEFLNACKSLQVLQEIEASKHSVQIAYEEQDLKREEAKSAKRFRFVGIIVGSIGMLVGTFLPVGIKAILENKDLLPPRELDEAEKQSMRSSSSWFSKMIGH